MPETTKKATKPLKSIKTGGSYPAPAKIAVAAKIGKPSKYTPEIARIICEQLSDGIPLRQICRDNDGFPAWQTVYDWMYRDDALGENGVGLSRAIGRARDIGYDAIAEDCLHIADNTEMGQKQVLTDDGASTTIEDMLGHRKLRIETRLKLLAKFHPTKYGDKLGVHGVEGAAPIKTEDTSASAFLDIIKNIEMTKRAGA